MSPISKGSLSARFYRVGEDLPVDFEIKAAKELQRYWFREIDETKGEDRSIGWINPRKVLDLECDWHSVYRNPWLVLGLRRDRKAINSTVLHARRDIKIDEAKKEKGIEKIGKMERQTITDQVKMDMLAEQTPSTNVYEMGWNIYSGLVVFASTSESLNAIMMDMFMDTFKVDLLPQNPFFVADKLAESKGMGAVLEELTPTLFSPAQVDTIAQAIGDSA